MKKDLQEVEEMEFVLNAQNGIQVEDEYMKVYSFKKEEREFSFLISKDIASERFGFFDFHLYGVFVGKIAPFEARMFTLPRRGTCHVKNFEQAEIELFDLLWEEIEAGEPIFVQKSINARKMAMEYIDQMSEEKRTKMFTRMGVREGEKSKIPLYWQKKDVRTMGHLRMPYEVLLASIDKTDADLMATIPPMEEEDEEVKKVCDSKSALRKYATMIRASIRQTLAVLETEIPATVKEAGKKAKEKVRGIALVAKSDHPVFEQLSLF